MSKMTEKFIRKTKKLTKFSETEAADSTDSVLLEKRKKRKFFLAEDRKKGRIKYSILGKTLYYMGGWPNLSFMIFTTLVIIVAYTKMQALFSFWGEIYFKKKDVETSKTLIFMNIFWPFVIIYFSFFRSASFYMGGVFLGRKLHSIMIFKLLYANINNFLKRTSFGIIFNRFSTDIQNIDKTIPLVLDLFTLGIIAVISTTLIIVGGSRSFTMLIPLLIYSLIIVYVRRLYMNASQELTRLKAISKSPVVGICSSCISGTPSVRSLNKEIYFAEKNDRNINENTKNSILNLGVQSWYRSTGAVINFWVILIPCYTIFLIEMQMNYDPNNHKENAASSFLFLTNLIEFSVQFSATLMAFSTLENNAISVERCLAYEEIKPEKGYQNLKGEEKNFKPPKKIKALKALEKEMNSDEKLFEYGDLELENVTARYPTSQKPVLNSLSLKIKKGQKIGIVGRTGAGKSSFIKLLWRALLPETGVIKIGGKNIHETDLKKYRRMINVITQDPNIFKGTLLSNITHKNLDKGEIEKIRDQLFELGFSSSKLDQKENLGFEVTICGENLSQSEKQIVCLIRALQDKTSEIVILDEATAYIDERVEKEFQKLIWEDFEKSTVFVIAHRIKNVVDCDRVLVFDNGQVIEDGDPQDLINKKGDFYRLWSKT